MNINIDIELINKVAEEMNGIKSKIADLQLGLDMMIIQIEQQGIKGADLEALSALNARLADCFEGRK